MLVVRMEVQHCGMALRKNAKLCKQDSGVDGGFVNKREEPMVAL